MPISLFSVGTNPRCPGEFTIRPPISISPLSGRSNPATQRSVVVLPQPLGPSKTQNSPSPTSRLIPRSASTRPCWAVNDFRRSLMLIIPITTYAGLLQFQVESESRDLGNPAAAPKLPDDRRDHDVILSI